ncbi:MAG TPA: hypothetical protein VNL13_01490 [Sulfolobales archaeon]|nr:hypothetical protein [Sulfolobales archaeon]
MKTIASILTTSIRTIPPQIIDRETLTTTPHRYRSDAPSGSENVLLTYRSRNSVVRDPYAARLEPLIWRSTDKYQNAVRRIGV